MPAENPFRFRGAIALPTDDLDVTFTHSAPELTRTTMNRSTTIHRKADRIYITRHRFYLGYTFAHAVTL